MFNLIILYIKSDVHMKTQVIHYFGILILEKLKSRID